MVFDGKNILIAVLFSCLLSSSLHFNTSVAQQDDGFFGIFPEDYYDPNDYGEDPSLTNNFDDTTDNGFNIETDDILKDSANAENINFIAAGDWKCNKESLKTVKNIVKFDPELVVGLGDYIFENTSAKCWFDLSSPIDVLMKIAIGNHDLDYASSYEQIISHYGLEKPYYSFNFGKIHFLAISSEHPFEKGSIQYDFIKTDLERTAEDPNILWKIVFLHKPFYTASSFDENSSKDLRKALHKLFENNGVDIVLSGHTQYYQRSLPLTYNKDDSAYPIVVDTESYSYNNNGIIFITAGTAGDDLHSIDFYLPYTAIQKREHGFLNFDVKDNGNTLIGTFYDNKNLDILDRFTLNKDSSGKKYPPNNFNSMSQEYYVTSENTESYDQNDSHLNIKNFEYKTENDDPEVFPQ
ncbi:MAG: metallophosphoesterase [Nitrososphaeraceae archaeon]